VIAFLEGNLACLTSLRGSYSLVHGDFKPTNIIVSNTGDRWHLSGLIDWEFACAGNTMFDLATALRHIDLVDGPLARGIAAGFSENGGLLPPEWRRVARLLDLNAMITFLSAPEDRANLYKHVRNIVDRTMADWDRFAV
jgi:Ser/Thr protein kinase RdoA (MazF antagonist)